MVNTFIWVVLLLLSFIMPRALSAQERHLIAYARFAGFQTPLWATKDLGLLRSTMSLTGKVNLRDSWNELNVWNRWNQSTRGRFGEASC